MFILRKWSDKVLKEYFYKNNLYSTEEKIISMLEEFRDNDKVLKDELGYGKFSYILSLICEYNGNMKDIFEYINNTNNIYRGSDYDNFILATQYWSKFLNDVNLQVDILLMYYDFIPNNILMRFFKTGIFGSKNKCYTKLLSKELYNWRLNGNAVSMIDILVANIDTINMKFKMVELTRKHWSRDKKIEALENLLQSNNGLGIVHNFVLETKLKLKDKDIEGIIGNKDSPIDAPIYFIMYQNYAINKLPSRYYHENSGIKNLIDNASKYGVTYWNDFNEEMQVYLKLMLN